MPPRKPSSRTPPTAPSTTPSVAPSDRPIRMPGGRRKVRRSAASDRAPIIRPRKPKSRPPPCARGTASSCDHRIAPNSADEDARQQEPAEDHLEAGEVARGTGGRPPAGGRPRRTDGTTRRRRPRPRRGRCPPTATGRPAARSPSGRPAPLRRAALSRRPPGGATSRSSSISWAGASSARAGAGAGVCEK